MVQKLLTSKLGKVSTAEKTKKPIWHWASVRSGIMDDKLILKNHVKEARQKAGLSQEGLANLVYIAGLKI
ncbi:MAG: hypothetical protein J1F68_01645 [Clostridiales bacterium]|nr:hypothetical protein [Clostridiales bacterium]